MSQRNSLPLLAGALLVLIFWAALPPARVVGLAEPPGERLPVPAQLAFRGSGSCAAVACHGGTDPKGGKRCEYTTWLAHDKHVQAYSVLLTERSKVIERNYRRLDDIKLAKAEKDALCLKCHAMDPQAALAGLDIATSDGIGCERCHGPAEKWLSLHYRRDFMAMTPAQQEALGFRRTKDLVTRARLCIECHLGSGDMQVDHDLYAAGHPRISFEFSAMLATMPPHWSVRDERQRMPDIEARSWAIGQVTSAQAALELLAYRADEKHGKPWPEFAEYDCFACHHDLKADSGRIKRGFGDRVPGALPLNNWYYAVPRALAGPGSPLVGTDFVGQLDKVRKLMELPLPDRDEVTREARAAAQALNPSLAALTQARTADASTVQAWFDKVEQQRDSLNGGWDEAAQYYLALAALHNGVTDLNPSQRSAAVRNRLKAMAEELRFGPKSDSPLHSPPYFVAPRNAPRK